MALKRDERERARFRCLRASGAELNGLGWKVAHIRDVGLGYRVSLQESPIEVFADHFHRFLSPTNMFVVPLEWAGLAEMPEMVAAIVQADGFPEPEKVRQPKDNAARHDGQR